MENIFTSGNEIVDQSAQLNISGNIIPQAWYKSIVRENGKPYLTAVVILADIVYWYKPTEIRDEGSGQVVALKKKFKADLLQRSYQQISDEFGISKKEATNAIIFLEKMGVIQRVFRNLVVNGITVTNVLFIELRVERLKELTYSTPLPLKRDTHKGKEEIVSEKGDDMTLKERGISLRRERVSQEKEIPDILKKQSSGHLEETPVYKEGETNTETTTENNNTKYPILSYQAIKEVMKKRIGYDAILNDRPYEKHMLDEILNIIVEVMSSKSSTIRVNREEKPTPIVKSTYWKLDMGSVLYVLDSLKNSGKKAYNIRAVMITALYNASMTISSYYSNLYAYHQASEAIPKT